MIETPVRRDEHATTTTRGGPPRYFALTLGPDGVLLAGTCERGIARSADGGHTWMAIDAGLDGAVVNAIVHHGDRWWAAAGEAGIVMSADGTRWERTPDLGGEVAFAVLTDTDGCIAGTDRGVRVRRSDRWEQIDPGPTSAVYRLVRAASGAVVAATEADGVWVGDGAGWRPAAPIEWPVFALDLDEDTWLAGTRGAGVLRSVDGGTSWKPANDGLPDLVVHAFARDDAGRIFAGTGLGVASSADEGRSWQPLGGDLSGHRIFSVTIDRRGRVLAGSYEGVWRSDPTWQQWEALDTGLGAQESFAVTSGSDGRAWLGRRAGVDVSDDGGRTWRRGPDDDAAGTTLSLLVEDRSPDGARVLAGTDGGVRRLLDGGWAGAGLDGMRVRSLVAGEAGALLAGTLGHGIQRREPDGRWVDANDGFPYRSAYDVLVSRVSGTVFVAGGDVIDGRKTGGVFRSTDGGRSWRATDHEPITTYRVVETRDGTLLAGAQRTCVLRSTDGGDTWQATRPEGLVDSKMYWLSSLSTDRVLLATGPQLLFSDDAGLSWTVGGAGLDGVTVYGIAEHGAGAVLVATSSGAYLSVDGGLSFVATS